MTKSTSHSTFKRLLIVGPLPPPVGGATASVQMLLDELAKKPAIHTIVINTSPKNYCRKTGLVKLESLRRAVRIFIQYITSIKNSDAILVFATSSFIFSLGCIFILLAQHRHVPIYLKPLGGDLSLYLKAQKKLIRSFMLRILSLATAVFAQTKRLQIELSKLCLTDTYYLPGYRPLTHIDLTEKRNAGKIRLIFLSQIMREKGALLLLEAIRILSLENNMRVACDFYGPILKKDQKEFFTQIKNTSGAKYCGIVEIGTASQVIRKYDVLVFPTSFIGEGHPGVIIEAMQAGVPVISTQFRDIPELITDGKNGLLVPERDSRCLATAIMRLAQDPTLREKMGKANYEKGHQFRSELVVSQMLEIMLPVTINQSRK